MIESIRFPFGVISGAPEMYYQSHYEYVKNILCYGNKPDINYFFGNDAAVDASIYTVFKMQLNDKEFAIDYSDHLVPIVKTDLPYFKFHTTDETIGTIPFPPISFHSWDRWKQVTHDVKYNIKADDIFYKGRYQKFTKDRKLRMRNILKGSEFFDKIDMKYEEYQHNYLESLNDCKASIIIPGIREHILDRTHMEHMALGIPFITTKMTTILPYNERLLPSIHYLELNDDFSNIEDLIDIALSDNTLMKEMSKNLKDLFTKTCTPKMVQPWVLNHI